MKPFEFVIPSRPVSAQARRAKRRGDWQNDVRNWAAAAWSAEHTLATGNVAVELVYFYLEAAIDIDNFAKPILDALIGLAYEDDATVTDLVIRRRSLQETMELANVTPVLAQAIDSGDEFVYVRIEDATDQSRLK
jgi:Holliday junction resolvase RusA-like endonuclease